MFIVPNVNFKSPFTLLNVGSYVIKGEKKAFVNRSTDGDTNQKKKKSCFTHSDGLQEITFNSLTRFKINYLFRIKVTRLQILFRIKASVLPYLNIEILTYAEVSLAISFENTIHNITYFI